MKKNNYEAPIVEISTAQLEHVIATSVQVKDGNMTYNYEEYEPY